MAEGAIATITNTLTNVSLPLMIEKLGLAVADAQAALDRNSINMLQELADSPVRINGNDYNLLNLGFVPTFYAFTEATVEVKLQFSMSESTEFKVGGEVKVNTKVVAVTVSASYARKFEQSAEGSSSIAARLVSLPVPDLFLSIIKANAKGAETLVTKITIKGTGITNTNGVFTATVGTDGLQLSAIIAPANASNKEVDWAVYDSDSYSILNTSASINSGLLTTTAATTAYILATAKDSSGIKAKMKMTITL